MHIDTSLTGDRTGISCIAISGYKHQKKYSDTGEEYDMNELVYRQLFTIGIQAPKGDQISFQKTREFIYYLKRQLGWNLQMVSTDGFQSADLRQSLILAGIPTCYISLDKTPDGYETFKIALQEQRAILILHEYQPLLFAEFQNVERNNMSGKIDHTVDGCFTEDTKIRLVDGRTLTIKELLLEQQYKDNYVYTFNEEKKIIEPKRIRKVFQTKITKDLVKVTLDNGETITCTPNHRFMLRDSSYEEIQNIKPGTSLMSLEYKDYKVMNIEKINNKIYPVFDLEIEDNHNFALDAGVFVHNSKDLLDSLVGSIYSASKNIKPEEIYSLENYDVLLQANTDETRYSANPINNLFFKPPEETVKTYAEKQNEKMDLEVQTIKKLRAEMTREENMNITDAQLLEMLSNSTLDDDMLIF